MTLSEADFQQQIVETARLCGWHHMHVRRTIGKGKRWTTGTSIPGWPDLTLWRPEKPFRTGRFLLAELKTDTGKVTDEQTRVIESLRAAGVDVHIWRPRDWDRIQGILQHERVAP